MDAKAQSALQYLLLIGGAVLIAAVVITLVISSGGSAQRSALRNTILAQDASDRTLVAHYNFDEGSGTIAQDTSTYHNDGVYDSIGNNNPSAPVAPPSTQWVQGRHGYAFNFDRAYYIYAPEKRQLALENGHYTIAFWMKLNDTANSSGGVIAKGKTGSLARNYVVRRVATTPGAMTYTAGDPDVSPLPTQFTQPWALAAGTSWEHRAVVVEPDPSSPTQVLVSLYVNGAPDTVKTPQTPVPKNHVSFQDGLYVGRTNQATFASLFFPGALDDLRVYNRSLSEKEIKNLYEAFR